jgi:hypothetical protein
VCDCTQQYTDGHVRVRHVCVTVDSSTQDGHVGVRVRHVFLPVPSSTHDGHVGVIHVCV